ncbi:hypothetical protein MLD38_007853 [Melastoma candidum]|uniref:Uncharacterized protein n=1 Tax=Melastoma candidum TaxID=119954 RepID=A0ACB9RSZ7_9MYRT|nr:hypothetical protein MLD38_007853 [Melastoma candidum]
MYVYIYRLLATPSSYNHHTIHPPSYIKLFLPYIARRTVILMASSSPKRSAKCHVRSISLPTRSHPASLKVVHQLNKLRSSLCPASSGSVRDGLVCLEELYGAVNEFLALTSTRDVIFSNRSEPCVDGLLDGLVRLLDAFDVMRDLVSLIKERARGVQSAIRRRNSDLRSVEDVASDFTRFRKASRKDIRKVSAELKRIEAEFAERQASDHDRAFLATMTVLSEVVASSASILQSLSSSLGNSNSRGSKWGILSKLVRRGEVAAAVESDCNGLEALDEAISCLSKDVSVEKAKITQHQLRDLENGIADIEDDLDGCYRRLIKTRASLLNNISQ